MKVHRGKLLMNSNNLHQAVVTEYQVSGDQYSHNLHKEMYYYYVYEICMNGCNV